MASRRLTAVVAALLAGGTLIALPGCDWFQGTESGQRLNPFLSSLSVSPSSVLCGNKFSITFRYDDPQGDIATARISLQLVGGISSREESPVWPDAQSRSSGTVTFGDFSFPCDAATKGGVYTVTVLVTDDRGHQSNLLTGQVRLNAPG
jgi:hypothetical protein